MELSQEVSHHFATIGTILASEIPESGSISYHNHLIDANKKFDFRLYNNKRLNSFTPQYIRQVKGCWTEKIHLPSLSGKAPIESAISFALFLIIL